MVRRKQAAEVAAGPLAKVAAAAIAGPVASSAVTLPYEVATWGGLPLYRCPHCPFDAFEEATILEHVATHLVVAERAAGSGLVWVADRHGNPVGG